MLPSICAEIEQAILLLLWWRDAQEHRLDRRGWRWSWHVDSFSCFCFQFLHDVQTVLTYAIIGIYKFLLTWRQKNSTCRSLGVFHRHTSPEELLWPWKVLQWARWLWPLYLLLTGSTGVFAAVWEASQHYSLPRLACGYGGKSFLLVIIVSSYLEKIYICLSWGSSFNYDFMLSKLVVVDIFRCLCTGASTPAWVWTPRLLSHATILSTKEWVRWTPLHPVASGSRTTSRRITSRTMLFLTRSIYWRWDSNS